MTRPNGSATLRRVWPPTCAATAPRSLLCVLLALGLLTSPGCGGAGFAERYRALHPGWQPAPAQEGAGLAPTLASLDSEQGSDYTVETRSARLLRLDRDPWQELPLASLLEPGFEAPTGRRHALVVERSCRGRDGLRRFGSSRTSWFLFEGGALVSFDHYGFGPDCAAEARFLPAVGETTAAGADEPTLHRDERTLRRYVAQRFPESRPSAEDQVQRGHRYLARGRLEDAAAALASVDRELAGLRDLLRDDAAGEERAAAQQEREARLRAQRAELSTALEAARIRQLDAEALDPASRYWHGH